MGMCLAYLAVGATCVPHVATCEPTTLYCDTGTSKCALRKAEGAACTTYQECQTDQVCTASKCTKQVVTCPLF